MDTKLPPMMQKNYEIVEKVSENSIYVVYKAKTKQKGKQSFIRVLKEDNAPNYDRNASLFIQELLYLCAKQRAEELVQIESFEIADRKMACVIRPYEKVIESPTSVSSDEIVQILSDLSSDLEFLRKKMQFEKLNLRLDYLHTFSNTNTNFVEWPLVCEINSQGNYKQETKYPSYNTLDSSDDRALLAVMALEMAGNEKRAQEVWKQKDSTEIAQMTSQLQSPDSFRKLIHELQISDKSSIHAILLPSSFKKNDTMEEEKSKIHIESKPIYPSKTRPTLKEKQYMRKIYPNGDIYEGELEHGKREGEGKLFFGKGTDHSFAGGWYEGSFSNDRMHGSGKIYNFRNTLIYEGNFVNNLKDGTGKLLEGGGDWYVGQFAHDFKHGKGIQYYRNDVALAGTWKAGKKHGEFKKYPEWQLTKENEPELLKPEDFSVIFYSHDQLTAKKPSNIRYTSENGSSKPIKEIITRYGVRLTTEDMATLEDGYPVGANIMNYYMRAVEAKYLEYLYESPVPNTNLERIMFMDSDFFSELTMDDLSSPVSYYENVAVHTSAYSTPGHLIFEEFDRILFIVNKSGYHWVLAEIFCKKDQKEKLEQINFHIYDSMARSTGKILNPTKDQVSFHLFNFALKEASKKGADEKIIDLIKSASLIYQHAPQQQDGSNCGVFVSRYIQHIAAGDFELKFDSHTMNAFRKEMRRVILGVYRNPFLLNRQE